LIVSLYKYILKWYLIPKDIIDKSQKDDKLYIGASVFVAHYNINERGTINGKKAI